ncbi:MAG: zincin-like metallopeptidase domain-containing protein [Melioribacteraceae bacterium]|nr:zincin-like metallopeptidase domain-containing protein [Melioribacteraceae bacterium]
MILQIHITRHYFYELIHATGHKSRLNRFESNQALEEYSKEELIAELGASYFCGLTGISQKVIENQAAYIDGWHKRLSSQPEILIEAAKEAQKAVDIISLDELD